MSVKFIDVDEPRKMAFPADINLHPAIMDTIEFGPVEFRAIEWLDLPIDLEPVLAPLGQFPIEAVETGSRVFGYRR